MLDYLHPETRLTLHDLCFLMLGVSDNTASNFLIELVGMGEINETLTRMGLKQTKLARRFMDFAARDAGRDNVTSAGDMADLLALLHRRALPGAPLLRELLLAQRWPTICARGCRRRRPSPARLARSTARGSDDAVFSVAGLLYAPVRRRGGALHPHRRAARPRRGAHRRWPRAPRRLGRVVRLIHCIEGESLTMPILPYNGVWPMIAPDALHRADGGGGGQCHHRGGGECLVRRGDPRG